MRNNVIIGIRSLLSYLSLTLLLLYIVIIAGLR